MSRWWCIHQLVFIFSLIFAITSSQGEAVVVHNENSSSSFSASLETLQKQIKYRFESVSVLRRAMTHPSFSKEENNNRALSILGLNLIQTSISLRCLGNNIDISPKDLYTIITKQSGMDSCTSAALRLGLQKIVRVSPKMMNSSIPPVVLCGAYRAILGAIAIDSGNVFWNVRRLLREEEEEEAVFAF